MSKSTTIRFVILTLAGVAVYYSGLMNPYYADDYKFVFESPSSKLVYFFTHQNSNAAWYRPVEAFALTAIQSVWGLNPAPVHLLILVFHVAVALCVIVCMEGLGFSSLSAIIAGGFMLLSQANAFAVLSIDTFSQVGGTLFGCLSLWFLRKYFTDTSGQSRYVVFSIIMFALSLWMKETSLGFLVAIGCVLLFSSLKQQSQKDILYHVKLFLLYVFITVLYLLIRASIISTSPDARYSVQLGLNIVQNLTMLTLAATTAISSVSVFQAFQNKELAVVALAFVSSSILIAIIGYGLWKGEKRTMSMGFITLSIAILSPAILISHASELYIYSAMPFVSILVGIGCETVYKKNSRFVRAGLLALGLVLLISHGYAIRSKATLMGENGKREKELLNQLTPYAAKVPPNGTLVLLNPPAQEPQYSIFVMSGFNVFKHGENIIHLATRRDDFKIWVMDVPDLKKWSPPDGAVLLTLKENLVDVVPFNKESE